MSKHRAPFDLYTDFCTMKDPGASGTIVVDRNPAYVPLVSATAETRTLARPTTRGVFVTLGMETDGGDITLTVTGGINEDGDTTFTFSDAGQHLSLVSMKNGSSFQWVKVSDYGLANIAPGDSSVLDEFSGLTATAAEINNVADASARHSILTAAGTVLTAADSGKVFFINNATGFIVATLPTAAAGAGCEYTFINQTANTSGNHTVVTASSANVITSLQFVVADAAGASEVTGDTISWVANQSVAGDKLHIISNGTNWFAYMFSDVAAGMTNSTAS